MSTCMSDHGFGIYGYRYTRTDYRQGAVLLTHQKDPPSLRGPCRKNIHLTRSDGLLRWFPAPPDWQQAILSQDVIASDIQPKVGIVRPISMGFADPVPPASRLFSERSWNCPGM